MGIYKKVKAFVRISKYLVNGVYKSTFAKMLIRRKQNGN